MRKGKENLFMLHIPLNLLNKTSHLLKDNNKIILHNNLEHLNLQIFMTASVLHERKHFYEDLLLILVFFISWERVKICSKSHPCCACSRLRLG